MANRNNTPPRCVKMSGWYLVELDIKRVLGMLPNKWYFVGQNAYLASN